MDDDKKSQNAVPKDGQGSSDENQSKNSKSEGVLEAVILPYERRDISEEKLSEIILKHDKWVSSDGDEGEKADLSMANLKSANLSKANLQEAYFMSANLQGSNLDSANLKKAYFGGANLQAYLKKADLQEAFLGAANIEEADLEKAILQKAKLPEANLQGANLKGANLLEAHLEVANLHKADLTNADLRKTVLDRVIGLSEAKLQYAKFEGATGLLGNEFAQADVTGTKLPEEIKEFKALEIVEETSQNARKIFFAMLLGCVYSWLTIATTTDVKLLTNTASSPLPIIGTEIPIAWFYIVAPLVLISLYFYFHLYLIKLWESLAGLPAIFPDGKRLDERAYPWLLNSLVRMYFRHINEERPFFINVQEWITIFLAWWVVPFTIIGFWLRNLVRHEFIETFIHIILLLLLILASFIFYNLCKIILQGNNPQSIKLFDYIGKRKLIFIAVNIFIMIFISIICFRYWGANFYEKDISIKPNDYYKIETIKKQLESVKGANLKGRNLNNADMYKVFLAKGDLRFASLNNASLTQANLQQANLLSAELQKAILDNANLEKASLRNVDLQQVSLKKTNLKQADLYNSRLDNANLQQAILVDVDLQKGSLIETNLRQANLERTNLKDTYLEFTNLEEANLVNVNLKNAKLIWVKLKNANLSRADMTGVKNLKIETISEVKTLYKAKLDSDLMKQVKKCCPHLLEKPKNE